MRYANVLGLLFIEQALQLRLGMVDNKQEKTWSLVLCFKPLQVLLRRICISITM